MEKPPYILILALLLHGASPVPAEMSNGVFSVRESKALHVEHKNEVLIAKDEINYLETLDGADEVLVGKVGTTAVLNVVQKNHPAVQFRKEVALHDDGRLELTVRTRLFPYRNDLSKGTITYSLAIPARTLNGTRFKALTGRIYKTKVEEGAFSAARPDGRLTADRCRFIAFEGDRRQLVFDCDPYGVLAFGDYCRYGEPLGAWNVAKQGEYVVFSFGLSARSYGGIFAGKMLIYEGRYDHERKHPYRKWHYHGATPALAQFTFGTSAETKGFDKADAATYSANRGWGWEESEGLTLVQSESADVIANCIACESGGSKTFLVDVTPGYYVLTLRVGHNDRAIGPFDIDVNGERSARDVRVAAGKTETVIVSRYVRRPEKQLRIGLGGAGPWAVRSLVIQALIYQNEDYEFDRGMWVVQGLFVPHIEVE